ncbi:MAG: primosomal protein N' [Candidatus Dadabacteria bacterium]|nr:primosomal protein N' [Candidatus Dadabacteria bacterium]
MKEAVQVAVLIPSVVRAGSLQGEAYYYSVPSHLQDGVQIGKRVLIPFKNRKALGFIIGFGKPPEGLSLKEIIDIVDEEPLFDEWRHEFLKWVSNYYMTPLGIVLKAAHPGGLGVSLKKVIKITEKGVNLLNKDKLSEPERLILKTLSISGVVTVRKLFNLVEGGKYEILNSLRRRGLVDFSYELRSNPKIKHEKVIIAAERVHLGRKWGSDNAKKSAIKSQILNYVIEHGRVPYSNIKEMFGDVSRHIKWLESKGYIIVEYHEVTRDPFSEITIQEDKPPYLTPDQERAFERIREAIGRGRFSAFLLHGVTGSGKTEVYLRVIGEVIKIGKEAIVLVPEISLTPQLVKRFKGRFGNKVAVIHSALSDGERFDAWRMARRGDVKIIIGARSAIFAPFRNLGIVVVDEEHEQSYKQDESPRYNARDLALVLGKKINGVVLLGSATPSVESYANALKEKFTYISLPLRVENRMLPYVKVVDMRGEGGGIFSKRLEERIIENYKTRMQTILFLNRRGFSTLIVCPGCGKSLLCPNCSINLTYHIKEDSLMCHYCGISEKFLKSCRNCSGTLKKLGMGTQKIEEEIKRILPEASVARMDRDTVSGKIKLFDLYRKLEKGEIDVLIGTQMVAKGHDLPGVTLVGVILADLALGIPDFRAGERTFQLITQVAGRAGRGDHTGKVIVQTYNPEHPSIRFAVEQDSISFLNQELQLREELGYPPFSKLINLKFEGKDEYETSKTSKEAGVTARRLLSKFPISVIQILGPSPSPIYRVRNRFRWHMLIKSANVNILHKFSKQLINVFHTAKGIGGINVSIDVDPLSFM